MDGAYVTGIRSGGSRDASGDPIENDATGSEDEPLFSSTGQIPSRTASPSLSASKQTLTYFNCLSIVIGIQIGSGIFSTPAIISRHVTTPIAGVLVWTFAGFLVWTGACCFIELGTLLSHNGGMQEYLRAGYGDLAGFLFSLTWLSVVRPCSIAIIAMIFAEHMTGLTNQQLGFSKGWFMHKIFALTAVWGLTVVNCLGLKTGAKVAGWFLVLKLFMVTSIILVGIYECIRTGTGNLFTGSDVAHTTSAKTLSETVAPEDYDLWGVVGEYVTAMLAALWVYGGWETIGFVAGEMKDPARDIPRVLNSAMAIVITSFTLASAAFYVVLPISRVRENDTPATTFANTLFGNIGFLLFTIGISISAMGAINANIFAISRLVVSASRRNYIPRFFAIDDKSGLKADEEEILLQQSLSKYWPSWLARCIIRFSNATRRQRLERSVPVYAMLLNSVLTSVYVLTGTFQALLTFIGIVEYIIFMFTVLALLRLRQNVPVSRILFNSQQDTTSIPAYRTYTINIILFVLLSFFLVVRGIVVQPVQGLMILVYSTALYGIWRWKQSKHAKPGSIDAARELATSIHIER